MLTQQKNEKIQNRYFCGVSVVMFNVSRLALKIVVMTREQGTGNREEVLGDFTFRYILLFEKPLRVYGFFPFTYLD
ncbi:hypothetical protein FJR09_03575 [Dolichospermum sp. UHCC 0406]|nr:hypothetical protein [Dolichospermum sp. UHCC 0406]